MAGEYVEREKTEVRKTNQKHVTIKLINNILYQFKEIYLHK